MGLFSVLASAKQEDIPSNVNLEASLDLKAAQGEDGSLPTFTLKANSGVQPMRLSGFKYPVIVDLKGARFAKKTTPVVMDHDLKIRLGHSTNQKVTSTGIEVEGVVSSNSDQAKEWVADSKNGFPFETSIGATVLKAAFLPAGKTTTVNGQSFEGPLIVAQQSSIYEYSVTVIGADRNTSASVAASFSILGGDSGMTYAEWLKNKNLPPENEHGDGIRASLKAMFDSEQSGDDKSQQGNGTNLQASGGNGQNLQDIDLTERRRINAQEELRCDKIKAAFQQYPDVKEIELSKDQKFTPAEFKAHAIQNNFTPDQVELHLLRANRPQNVGPAIHASQDLDEKILPQALQCSIVRGFGMRSSFKASDGKDYGYEHQFTEQVLEASDQKRIRNMSLHQMMDMTIRAATGCSSHNDRKSNDFIHEYVQSATKLKASGPFSTLTVSNILEDAGNKFLLSRFMMRPSTWGQLAGRRNLNDFKPAKLYRLDENLGYLKVGPTGELEHGTLSDTKRTIQAETYGRIIGLSRHHIINDDLDAFRQILIGLADGAAWAIEAEFWSLVLSMIAGNTFFTSARGNLISDDLSIAGVTVAEQKLKDMVSSSGKPIFVGAGRLVVGTQDSVLADQINRDRTVVSTTIAGGFESNPHAGKYGKVESGWLNNTGLKKPDGTSLEGQSSDHWLLAGEPDEQAIAHVGLLNGRAEPFIEQSETSFDTLGMQWRGYHDFGVAEGDYQGAVLSLGDDSSV